MKKIFAILILVLFMNLAIVSAIDSKNTLPDLTIKSIKATKQGINAKIDIKVTNEGEQTINGFWYFINYGDNTGEFVYYSGTLAPRQTSTITLTHSYTNTALYGSLVNLDPLNLIQESKENNNIKEFILTKTRF
nr:hypothetical protein [Nanoarchaeum sp.]